ncbi:MAG: hypothetical protein AB1306_07260 [Nitrospirota bacterium]
MKIGFPCLILVIFFVLIGQPSLALAECPDFGIFLKEIDPAQKTWKNLYRLFKTYQVCDDGAYGEGYSDFVAQSLSKYWDRFDELTSLTKHDPSFQNFVLKHIDATDDPDDLKLLLNNVRKRCPSTDVSFCKEIEQAALSALESIGATNKRGH